jgi:ribulose-5-phosphate 4-epimerase/fuculose-1-phosphate aldolase
MDNFNEIMRQTIWVAHRLFDRGAASGSTGNISFRFKDRIFISGTGTCFGTLNTEDFSALDLDGNVYTERKPSKEWPLHLIVYKAKPDCNAVIHTHGRSAILWSCLEHKKEADCVPPLTPYLKMKLGSVGMIPYALPGTNELFEEFEARVRDSDGWILERHGSVIPGCDVMNAFYSSEELEATLDIVWELSNHRKLTEDTLALITQ